jgi:hypothetical protein
MRRLAMVAVLGMGSSLAACGSSSTHTPPGGSASPSVSASVSGPCASLKTTTAIVDVPPACAALWAPYQVTKVPPSDVLQQEHVPLAPPVKNMTNGAVSDADAQLWANASNRDSGWYKWAEANDQPVLFLHLVGPAVIAANEQQALTAGASIDLPDCDLYPTRNALFPITAADNSYFAQKHLPTDNHFVFVVVYAGPCSETIRQPDGTTSTFQISDATHTVFVPGVLRSDPLLGDLWYSDAGGNCHDPAGPPPEWCQR